MENQGPPSIIKRKYNPSRHYLVAKLCDYGARLEVFEAHWKNLQDNEKLKIVDSCKSLLKDIEAMLEKRRFLHFNTFSIWHLFHRVDENFYLLMPVAELKAYAWELTQALKLSPIPQTTKTDWSSKLMEVYKKLEAQTPKDEKPKDDKVDKFSLLSQYSPLLSQYFGNVPKEDKPKDDKNFDHETEEARRMIKAAAYINNDCIDNLFWDYWCRKLFVLIYAGLVLISSVVALLFVHGSFILCDWSACFLGAMGGLGSGILSAQIENIPYGQFWTNVCAYALARPLQGAIAALMVFWMLQSQYLIKIDPPLAPGQITFTCSTSSSKQAAFRNVTSNKQDPLVTLKAAPGMQVYLYMLVLYAAGFCGDKLMRNIAGSVINKLFAGAEKTKESK